MRSIAPDDPELSRSSRSLFASGAESSTAYKGSNTREHREHLIASSVSPESVSERYGGKETESRAETSHGVGIGSTGWQTLSEFGFHIAMHSNPVFLFH